jgi:serine/threonine-protein kinase HipA
MTLLGLNDGDNATTGHGYPDIVDFIIQHCTNVEENLQELYRRVAFNICIGNSDDHFRNHGFLLTPKGWTLSPAYDMNPTLNEHLSLLISTTSNKADLGILLDACEDYFLNRETAEKIISEVLGAVKDWREPAIRLGISKKEMDMFDVIFTNKTIIRNRQ